MKPANFAPVYCALYPALAEIARKHGYAMAIHGTMARDFDLICIPWVETPSKPEEVVAEITATYATTDITNPGYKPHGRLAYSVCFGFGEFFADVLTHHNFSVMASANTTTTVVVLECSPTSRSGLLCRRFQALRQFGDISCHNEPRI